MTDTKQVDVTSTENEAEPEKRTYQVGRLLGKGGSARLAFEGTKAAQEVITIILVRHGHTKLLFDDDTVLQSEYRSLKVSNLYYKKGRNPWDMKPASNPRSPPSVLPLELRRRSVEARRSPPPVYITKAEVRLGPRVNVA